MTLIFTAPQSSDTVTSCTIFKMLYNFTTTYILLNLFPFMSESWAKNTVANIILPAYIICALFMEVGLNYTNIIGNEPILHEICVDFESQSDMKQTHKKRLEKKKRRKFMNRSNFFYKFSLLFRHFCCKLPNWYQLQIRIYNGYWKMVKNCKLGFKKCRVNHCKLYIWFTLGSDWIPKVQRR